MLPVTSGYLEADFIPDAQNDVAFDIVLRIRQKETLASVLIADTSVLTRTRNQFSSYRSSNPFLAQHLEPHKFQ